MAKKKLPKEIPLTEGSLRHYLTEARGVATFDTNELLVLVTKPVGEVATAFQKLRKLKTWIKNACGKTISMSEPSYLVYRLKGHKWTIIHAYTGRKYVNERDAKALSKALGTKGLYYGNSDTSSATGYDLFYDGNRLEHFFCFEGIEFESKIRQVEPPEDGRNIHPFVEQFMKEQDAFAPNWTPFFPPFGQKPGATIKLEVLPEDVVERLDYLSA